MRVNSPCLACIKSNKTIAALRNPIIFNGFEYHTAVEEEKWILPVISVTWCFLNVELLLLQRLGSLVSSGLSGSLRIRMNRQKLYSKLCFYLTQREDAKRTASAYSQSHKYCIRGFLGFFCLKNCFFHKKSKISRVVEQRWLELLTAKRTTQMASKEPPQRTISVVFVFACSVNRPLAPLQWQSCRTWYLNVGCGRDWIISSPGRSNPSSSGNDVSTSAAVVTALWIGMVEKTWDARKAVK